MEETIYSSYDKVNKYRMVYISIWIPNDTRELSLCHKLMKSAFRLSNKVHILPNLETIELCTSSYLERKASPTNVLPMASSTDWSVCRRFVMSRSVKCCTENKYKILVGFGLACAPVRCAHPSFWVNCHAKRGAARPPAHRSVAVPSGE